MKRYFKRENILLIRFVFVQTAQRGGTMPEIRSDALAFLVEQLYIPYVWGNKREANRTFGGDTGNRRGAEILNI